MGKPILSVIDNNGNIIPIRSIQGTPGISPHIGANGNWYVGETDTGVRAQGDNYVLTKNDKTEIAAQVVDMLPKYAGEVEDV